MTAPRIIDPQYDGSISAVGLRVRESAGDRGDRSPLIVAVTGVPTDSHGVPTLALRKDPAGANTVLYVDPDGDGTYEAIETNEDFGATGIKTDLITESTGGAGVTYPDTIEALWGAGGDLVVSSDGTDATITAPRNLLVDGSGATSQIVVRTGTDTAATEVDVQNNTGTSILTIRGSSEVASPDGVPHLFGTGDDLKIECTGALLEIEGANGTDAASLPMLVETGSASSVTGAHESGSMTLASGDVLANGNAGAQSGAAGLFSGDTNVTSAHVGGPTGGAALGSGNSDCNDAGGTGGASGDVTVSSGTAASTLGTSGATGAVLITTGNSDDANSGRILLQTGTAGAVRGGIDLDALDVALPDSMPFTLGTGVDDSLQHDGTDTIWTHSTGDLLIDNEDVVGAIRLQLGTDTAATEVAVLNDTGASLLTVTGAGLATLGVGGVWSFAGEILYTHAAGSVTVSNAAAELVLYHDDVLTFADPADTTKRARVDAGAVTAGQTRVITMADADVDLADIATVLARAEAIKVRYENGTTDFANLGNGGTAGFVRTNNLISHGIGGQVYSKASTDDVWDLSAEPDLAALEYRAYWLYLDNVGAGTIVAGTIAASEAAAIAALPAVDPALSVAGCYIAGPSTDFDAAGGLAAQGTIINGWPASAW